MRVLLQAFAFAGENRYYSLGILFLRSVLLSRPETAGKVEVEVLQSDYFDDVDEVAARIRAFDPDVLGLSVAAWSWELSARLAAAAGERGGRPFVVCGGAGLHAREREFLEENLRVDAVVPGSGEAVLVDLVAHLLDPGKPAGDLSGVRGILWRDGDAAVLETPRREANFPLSEVASPYDDVPLPGGPAPERLLLETERYCLFRCSYCDWAGRGVPRGDLSFPVETVRREILRAAERGFSEVHFYDAALNQDSARFSAILDAVEETPDRGQFYFFFLRHELVDRAQAERLMRFTRPALVSFGIESLSPRALRGAGRPDRTDRLELLLRTLARNERFKVMGALVLGLPGEDLGSFVAGAERLLAIPRLQVLVSLLSVAPGTALRAEAASHGLAWRPRGVPFLTSSNDLPAQDLERAFEWINGRLGSNRIALTPLAVPLSRLSNPEILPAGLRASLGPADRVLVGVRGIENGWVEGTGVHLPGSAWIV